MSALIGCSVDASGYISCSNSFTSCGFSVRPRSIAALQLQVLARRRMSLEGVSEVVEVEQDQVRVQTNNTEVKERGASRFC